MLEKNYPGLSKVGHRKVNPIYRTRKLLTSDPSTPVINDAPIGYGKLVALGFSTGVLVASGFGEPNEI